MAKQIIITWYIAMLISTGLYATGNMKNTNTEPYINIPIEDSSKVFSLGLGVSAVQANSYLYEKENVTDITIKAGYNLSEYFAIEFRGSKGVSEGEQINHDYSYGIYLKPKYSINENLDIYSLVGYAKSKITLEKEVDFTDIKNNYTKQNDFSYGLGLEYKIFQDWSLFVDVLKYIKKDTIRADGEYAIEVNAITFGTVYHF